MKSSVTENDRSTTPNGSEYAEVGLIPIRIAASSKRPIDPGWETADPDASAVDQHLAQGGNVGLRMGRQPSGDTLIALDEDEPGAIKRATTELGALPKTLTSRSGGGGKHWIFRWPADLPLPRNVVKWRGRGIDVRSDGGQIVVAPSRHESGGLYEWIDVRAPAELPKRWARALASEAGRRNDTDRDELEQPAETVWLSNTARAKWIASLASLIGESGAWDDGRQAWALQMFGWLARCMPGEELTDLVHELEEWNPERTEKYLSMVDRVTPLDGPSREVRDALREAFDAVDEHLSTHPNALAGGHPLAYERRLAESRTRAKERARKRGVAKRYEERAARAAEIAPDATVPEADPPRLVYRDGVAWLLKPGDELRYLARILPVYGAGMREGDAIIELSKDSNAVSSLGLENEKRMLKPEREIKRMFPRVSEIARDFSVPGVVYDPDTRDLTEGYSLPTIEPRYDADAAAWLNAMFREHQARFEMWIASAAQRYISRPAACATIVGPRDVGKSVFFRVLSWLWRKTGDLVLLKKVLGHFNAEAALSPIWVDDECVAQRSRDVAFGTAEFRSLIQSTAHSIEAKFRDATTLRGACRLGITGNDLADVRLAGAEGPEALAAVKARFLVRVVPPSDRAACMAALEKLRKADGSLDWERLAGHFRWIQESHAPIPNDAEHRFIGNGGDVDAATQIATASVVDSAPEVFEALRGAVLDEGEPCTFRELRTHPALFVWRGRLWVHPDKLARVLVDAGARTDLRRVQASLKPFTGDAKGRRFRVGGKHGAEARYWDLSAGALTAAGISPADLARHEAGENQCTRLRTRG